ncbi:MAG: sugar phosphate isomerase/epimerase [Planctomycetia bacterium]|nr:sugar phosphate isomerase/epimerase [Planctomycetia bacterium]
MNRRDVLKSMAVLAALGITPAHLHALEEAKKNGIRQSVCLWCYNGYLKKNNLSLEQFCQICKDLGIGSVELTGESQWEVMKNYGLICAMCPSGSIPKGFNRVENHKELVELTKKRIDLAVKWNFPNVICFSGNCEKMGKEEGLANCVVGLKQVVPYAEKNGIVLNMEFLNSHGHKDYMGDSTAWLVKLVHELDSPSFKVLYDIYHAAEMGEDTMKDIREHHDCWGHYHTGGWPGRAEIDFASQRLDYTALMKAILETGYTGWVGQEFCPRRDAIQSLKEAYQICNV